MPKTDEAPAWFTAQMEANRKKIAEDTAATVGKLSATLGERIDQTNRELSKHRHDVDAIMKEMQKNIDRCIKKDDPVNKEATWAAAASTQQVPDKHKLPPPPEAANGLDEELLVVEEMRAFLVDSRRDRR